MAIQFILGFIVGFVAFPIIVSIGYWVWDNL